MYHIRDYLNSLRIKGLTSAYIERKYRNLMKFNRFLGQNSIINIMKADLKDLEDYIAHLFREKSCFTGKRRSRNQIRDHISTVKNYFKYLSDNSYILYNPAEKLDLPKKDQYLPRGIMSEKEVLKILSIPDIKAYQGYLDKLILEILYSTGIRNRELINLDIYDIDFEAGTLTVKEGKGKKDRIIPIGETALKMIHEYLYIKRPKITGYTGETKLLLNEAGYPLKSEDILRKVKKYAKQAGSRRKITPHSFRHTFAVHLLRNGADIISIKEMLGHSSLATTQIYLKIQDQDLKKTHDKCHPREKIRIKE